MDEAKERGVTVGVPAYTPMSEYADSTAFRTPPSSRTTR